MRELTVGIPCYNEAPTIGKVVDDFRRVFPDATILVIDNASTDRTAEIAREHGANVIREERKGKGYAVQRLFREASSELLLMVDGDDTYPAAEALKLLAAMDNPAVETVIGNRTSSDPSAFKAVHTKANDLLAGFIRLVFGKPSGDLFSGYRLFRRSFYRNVPLLATGFEVETELVLQTLDKGFVQREVPIEFRARPEGSFSKLNTVRDGLRVLRVILILVKDYKPMLFFGLLALCLACLALLIGLSPMIDYVRYDYVYHVPLAILATGVALLSALSATCALILDTIVRQRREESWLRMRNLPDSR